MIQTCIVTHESNGIDIITALILNDISPLCRYQMEMVLQLKVCSFTRLLRLTLSTSLEFHAGCFTAAVVSLVTRTTPPSCCWR